MKRFAARLSGVPPVQNCHMAVKSRSPSIENIGMMTFSRILPEAISRSTLSERGPDAMGVAGLSMAWY